MQTLGWPLKQVKKKHKCYAKKWEKMSHINSLIKSLKAEKVEDKKGKKNNK